MNKRKRERGEKDIRVKEGDRERKEELKEEEDEEAGRKEEREEEEIGPRSLLRSNMLSPHEVSSLSLPGPLILLSPFSGTLRNPFHVRPGTSLRYIGAPSHLINVLIAVNDSKISLTRPKMENERERGATKRRQRGEIVARR